MPPQPADGTAPAVAVPGDADELYEQAPCGYLSATPDGVLLRVNETLLGWTGHRREELVGRRRFVDLLTPGSRIYHETHYAPLLRMQQGAREIAFTMRRRDGSRFPVLVNSRVLPGHAPGEPDVVLTSVFDATNRRRYEEELLLARRRAEDVGERLAAMQRVTLRIALAIGLGQTVLVAARSAVEVVGAAVAAVWLHGDDPSTFVLQGRATAADVERPTDSSSSPAPDRTSVRATWRSGGLTAADVPVALPWDQACREHPEVTDVLGSQDPQHGTAAPTVVVLASLHDGQRRIGLLACRLDGPDELGAGAAAALAATVRQVGVALARAQLYEQHREMAETLQHSLLPTALPGSPDFSLARIYVAGQTGTAAGGDFYDAYPLDGSRLVVVIGDVVGRGIHAAATMGQLRSAVRALAPSSGGPGELLSRLDRFVESVPAAVCSTVVTAVLDVPTGRLTYACAGHPPPMLLEPDGAVRTLWGGRSLPLGVRPHLERDEATVELAPGSRLLLYTDGLVERRDVSLGRRLDELADELAATSGLRSEEQLREIESRMLGPTHALDDVCLLLLSVHGRPGRP